jgi:hypothetical protein
VRSATGVSARRRRRGPKGQRKAAGTPVRTRSAENRHDPWQPATIALTSAVRGSITCCPPRIVNEKVALALFNVRWEELVNQQDAAHQRAYVFSGRIHPERNDWNIDPPYGVIHIHQDGARSVILTSIVASQVTVTVNTSSDDSALEIKNRVTRQVRNLADALGFVTASALDVEIISCVTPDGSHLVFDTIFGGLLDDAVESRESQELFNILIDQANKSYFVHTALGELRNAIREPLDTCANCYRAIESIRQEYLEGKPDSRSSRERSWVRLREAVGVDEAELRWLEAQAKPRRHGRPIDVTHAERERAMRLARRVVESHCRAIQGTIEPVQNVVSEASYDTEPVIS